MKLRAPVTLASGSPRRQELLQAIVPIFEVLAPDVDETLLPGEHPEKAVERLSFLKANTVAALRPNSLVIAADTLVAFETSGSWRILGKPVDPDDAIAMLTLRSGITHQVFTGVTLSLGGKTQTFAEKSSVEFRVLDSSEIAEYVSTGESLDKAGSYAIQGGAKGFVSKVDGSLSNVIGLPIERLADELRTLSDSVAETI